MKFMRYRLWNTRGRAARAGGGGFSSLGGGASTAAAAAAAAAARGAVVADFAFSRRSRNFGTNSVVVARRQRAVEGDGLGWLGKSRQAAVADTLKRHFRMAWNKQVPVKSRRRPRRRVLCTRDFSCLCMYRSLFVSHV